MPSASAQNINWFSAPAVPVEIVAKHARGEDIGGEIVTGPGGQKTFVKGGRVVEQGDIDDSWRDSLKERPDRN